MPDGFDHRSRWVDLSGPVHYLDYGGPSKGPLVVAVHGLGGSALNWSAIATLLTARCRLIAPDLAGHGLTESLGRATTVEANRRLLHGFLKSSGPGPVILLGNSMGAMVSLLEAGAHPDAVAGLVLLDTAWPFVPALPDPMVAAMFAWYGIPGVGALAMRRRQRMPPERIVGMIMNLCCADPDRVPAGVIGEHVEMARRRTRFTGIDRDLLPAGRSVVATAGGRPAPRTARPSGRSGRRSCSYTVTVTVSCRSRRRWPRSGPTRRGSSSCCPASATSHSWRLRRTPRPRSSTGSTDPGARPPRRRCDGQRIRVFVPWPVAPVSTSVEVRPPPRASGVRRRADRR